MVRTENKSDQDKKLEERVIKTVTDVLQNFIDTTDLATAKRTSSETLTGELLNKQAKRMRPTDIFGSKNHFLDEFPSPPKGQFLNNHVSCISYLNLNQFKMDYSLLVILWP